MKEAIAGFESAPLWAQMRYIVQDPWTGLDGPVIRTLLERQAVLATVFERTAGSRS